MSTVSSSGQPDVRAGLSLGGWFDADPEPRFALDFEGRLVTANIAAQAVLMEGNVGTRPTGRLSFGTASCDAALLCGVAAVRAAPHKVCRLILRLQHGDWTAANLTTTADLGFIVLAFHNITSRSVVAVEAVADAFHLTPSEAAVLRLLCTGECPKSVARCLATSEHTVRAQMRSIYAKMGTRGLTNTVAMASVLMA